jgi:hypothetical protein
MPQRRTERPTTDKFAQSYVMAVAASFVTRRRFGPLNLELAATGKSFAQSLLAPTDRGISISRKRGDHQVQSLQNFSRLVPASIGCFCSDDKTESDRTGLSPATLNRCEFAWDRQNYKPGFFGEAVTAVGDVTPLKRHDDSCVNELGKELVDAVRLDIGDDKASL